MLTKDELNYLSKKNPIRLFAEIIFNWSLVLIFIFLAIKIESSIVKFILFFLVSIAQYSLMLLLHEVIHGGMGKSKRLNFLVGEYLLSLPFGGSFEETKEVHLRHHQHFETDLDPDKRYFYLNNKSIWAVFLNNFKNLKSLRLKSSWYGFFKKIVFQLLIWLAFTQYLNSYFLGSLYYLIYWFFTTLFFAIFLDKLRLWAEHFYFKNQKPIIRTFESNAFEKIILAPWDSNYHAEHHFYPGIPHWNYKIIRKRLVEDKSLQTNNLFVIEDSYLKFINKVNS